MGGVVGLHCLYYTAMQVNELESYQRRWNLKISGVPEQDEENVKMTVIDLLSRISPTIADNLQKSVDVAHRLGPVPDQKKVSVPHNLAASSCNSWRERHETAFGSTPKTQRFSNKRTLKCLSIFPMIPIMINCCDRGSADSWESKLH